MFRKLIRGLRALANHECVLVLHASGTIRANMDINGNDYYVIYDWKKSFTFKDSHDTTILKLYVWEINDTYECLALTVNILMHYFGC